MPFDRNTDKIAITVPCFTFKKAAANTLLEDIYDLLTYEPYLLTIAIDSNGIQHNQLAFNFTEFPNTKRNSKIEMIGDGHLVYGPGNPGEYVAISIIVMESARETIQAGKRLESILNSESVQSSIKDVVAIMKSVSKTDIFLDLTRKISQIVVSDLISTRDRHIHRLDGIFFRDRDVPFSINRQFTHGNDFAEVSVKVIPLEQENGQGLKPKSLEFRDTIQKFSL
jgi:hypothetical protein